MIHLVVGGLGSIGSRYCRLLKEYGEEVRISDINIAADWKNVDICWICSPSQIHHEDVFYALNQGIYVFCEKPLTDDLRGAEDIRQASLKKRAMSNQQGGGKVYVSCNMRFHPCVQLLKKDFDAGTVGEPLYIRYNYSHYLPFQRPNWMQSYVMNDGIILDCIHELDLALWFGGELNNLQGFCSTLELPIHDFSRMHIVHKNNLVSEIALDFLRRDKVRQIEIIGTKGTLQWRSEGKEPEKALVRFNSEILYEGEIEPNEMYRNQIKYVMEQKPHNLDEHIKILKIALEARNAQIQQG